MWTRTRPLSVNMSTNYFRSCHRWRIEKVCPKSVTKLLSEMISLLKLSLYAKCRFSKQCPIQTLCIPADILSYWLHACLHMWHIHLSNWHIFMYSLPNPDRKPRQFASPCSYLLFVHKHWNWGFHGCSPSPSEICYFIIGNNNSLLTYLDTTLKVAYTPLHSMTHSSICLLYGS